MEVPAEPLQRCLVVASFLAGLGTWMSLQRHPAPMSGPTSKPITMGSMPAPPGRLPQCVPDLSRSARLSPACDRPYMATKRTFIRASSMFSTLTFPSPRKTTAFTACLLNQLEISTNGSLSLPLQRDSPCLLSRLIRHYYGPSFGPIWMSENGRLAPKADRLESIA